MPIRLCSLLLALLLTACAGLSRDRAPISAAGTYRLDYSGIYGVGRVDLLLQDGQISGLSPQAGMISYRGTYRLAADGRNLALDLIAHLPPLTSEVAGVVVIGTARDIPVAFELPPDLAPGSRWPVRIETQQGPVTVVVTRLERP